MYQSIKKIIQEKCPICNESNIFESKGSVLSFKIPKMHTNCPKCHYHFEKEPGYFMGAMYVSYALCIGEMLGAFLLGNIFFNITVDYGLYLVIPIVILLWPFNYRMSRVIWMYLM